MNAAQAIEAAVNYNREGQGWSPAAEAAVRNGRPIILFKALDYPGTIIWGLWAVVAVRIQDPQLGDVPVFAFACDPKVENRTLTRKSDHTPTVAALNWGRRCFGNELNAQHYAFRR